MNPYKILIRFVRKHFPDSVKERKKVLGALIQIVPEKDVQHDQLCVSLRSLEIHEKESLRIGKEKGSK